MPTAALTQPATRVSRTGNALRKPAGGPPALTKRHLALVEFMVHGLPTAFPRHPDIEPHVPLDVNQAADCVGLRRKLARDLLTQPLFVKAYNAAIASLRTGEHARSVHKLIDIRDEAGAGKAADRKVQMGAALAILGEQAKGLSVNVGVQVNSTTVVPGIVVRRFEPRRDDATTIDHEAA